MIQWPFQLKIPSIYKAHTYVIRDEPPSKIHVPNHQSDEVAMDYTHLTGAFYVGNEGMIHNNYQ